MQVPPPPLPACEQERLNRMKENDRRLEELGIKKLVIDLRARSATVIEKSKEKDKASPDDDDYNPESEDEHDSDDSSEVWISFTVFITLAFLPCFLRV